MLLFLFYIFIRDLEKIFKITSKSNQCVSILLHYGLPIYQREAKYCQLVTIQKKKRHYTSPNLHHTSSRLHCGKFPVLPVMKGRSKAGTALNNRKSCDLVLPRGKDI